jgi:hypothetical protein
MPPHKQLRVWDSRPLHPKAHSLVRVAWLNMCIDRLYETDVCKKAGVNVNTWTRWKYHGKVPDLLLIEAVLQAMGLRLKVTVASLPVVEGVANEKDPANEAALDNSASNRQKRRVAKRHLRPLSDRPTGGGFL